MVLKSAEELGAGLCKTYVLWFLQADYSSADSSYPKFGKWFKREKQAFSVIMCDNERRNKQ